MMDIKTLKLIIESALADGILSPTERDFIYQNANQANIPIEQVETLINEIINNKTQNDVSTTDSSGFVTVQTNNLNSSGFISTSNEPNQELSSGFISNTDKQQHIQHHSQPFFINVELMSDQGAMSLIYKARRHSKIVAVKRLRPENRADNRYIDLFFKEFDNANQFVHPNIAQVYDKGEDDQGPFYYMEYVDGKPLSKIITPQGIKDTNLVVKIMTQLCDALSYIHLKQVFHRDLKPDNILITFKGDNVKLIDFGLAASSYFDDFLQKAGTPKYAAPELNSNASSADHRTDIYSLGLIFLEMLTGTVEIGNISKITNRNFGEIIEKCLKNNPNDRFNDCKMILQALHASQKQDLVPDWLIEKIREFAEDGVISEAEWKILNIHANSCNVDNETLKAYIELEIDKLPKKESNLKTENSTNEKNEVGKKTETSKTQPINDSRKKAEEHLRLLKIKMGLSVEDNTQENKNTTKKTNENKITDNKTVVNQKKHTNTNPIIQSKPETTKKNTTEKKTGNSWIIWILVLAIIISPVIYFKPQAVSYIFNKYILNNEKTDDADQDEDQQNQYPIRYVAARKGLHLRSSKSPDNSKNIIKTYPYGTAVRIIHYQDQWCKVSIDGQQGYMWTKYLTDKKPTDY